MEKTKWWLKPKLRWYEITWLLVAGTAQFAWELFLCLTERHPFVKGKDK
jgi:hypothetical protein